MVFGKKQRRITRLLLVEDEALIAFDSEHHLVDGGYEVVATVDRAADAIAVIESGRAIDLVLVDVTLADGSGLDVARTANARAIPVMFVTGAFPDEAEPLATGCLAKPYTQRDLLAAILAIEGALDGKAPRRLPGGFRLFDRAGV